MKDDVPAIRLGSVLVTLLEPAAGSAKAFNRWYERDHFYAGCMMGENFFSGRRWVATRELKDLRFPRTTPITPELDKGSYLASYWILDQRYDEAVQWSIAQVLRLHEQERMAPPRENISSGFYRYDFGVFRDADGVPAELALEHPFRGIGLTFVDFYDDFMAGDDALETALTAALEACLPGSDCSMSLCLSPQPLPDEVPSYVPRVRSEELQRRRLLLHFFDAQPVHCWRSFTASLSTQLQALQVGDIVYAAPFIPTIPGTDRYVDQL